MPVIVKKLLLSTVGINLLKGRPKLQRERRDELVNFLHIAGVYNKNWLEVLLRMCVEVTGCLKAALRAT